jgi:hypothetical protein
MNELDKEPGSWLDVLDEDNPLDDSLLVCAFLK